MPLLWREPQAWGSCAQDNHYGYSNRGVAEFCGIDNKVSMVFP